MESLAHVTLDMQNPALAVVVYAKQNDRLARKIVAQLVDGSSTWTVPGTAAGVIRYMKPDGTSGFYDVDENNVSAVIVSGSTATLTLAEQALTIAGDVLMELNFYDTDGSKLTTFTWTLRVQESVLPDTTIVSSSYYNVLTTQVAAAVQAAEEAESLVAAAAGAVRFDTAQTLTSAQQAQARTNIGALDAAGAAAAAPVQSVNGDTGAVIVPNENLLVNWDMKRVVNSRAIGNATKTNAEYVLDMWYLKDATVSVASGHVGFTAATGAFSNFGQHVVGNFPSGTALTLSVHCNVNSYTGGSVQIGQIVSGTSTILDRTYISATGDQTITVTTATTADTTELYIQIVAGETSAVDVDLYEWKLELGNISTLTPGDCADYTNERLRCSQWVQVLYSSSACGVAAGFIDWQTPKRARVALPVTSTFLTWPTVTVTSSGAASYGTIYAGTAGIAGNSIDILAARRGMLFLSITLSDSTGVQQNMPCVWGLVANERCVISWEPAV